MDRRQQLLRKMVPITLFTSGHTRSILLSSGCLTLFRCHLSPVVTLTISATENINSFYPPLAKMIKKNTVQLNKRENLTSELRRLATSPSGIAACFAWMTMNTLAGVE